MQSKLILVLQTTSARYLHVNELGDLSAVHEAVYDEAISFPVAQEVIVLVPPQDVLLTQPILPKMNRAKMLQALPYALEDQLVEDLDALHFAVSTQQADGSLPVAVVSHAKMQQWMSILANWQLKPDLLLPLTMALPLKQPRNWSGMVEEMSVIRCGEYGGFACDNANLPEMLDIALSSTSVMPNELDLQNYTETAVNENLDIEITVKEDRSPHGEWLEDIARYAGQQPYINLLQSAYVVKKPRLEETKRLFHALAVLGAVLVLLLFLYPTISFFILHGKVSSIENQIDAIYQRNFPDATSIVDPKLRMEDKLKSFTEQATKNRVLVLMGYTGKALKQNGNVKLNRLDFQANQLTLQLTAMTTDDFNKFINDLTQQGLSVKQQNATIADARINATLIIE